MLFKCPFERKKAGWLLIKRITEFLLILKALNDRANWKNSLSFNNVSFSYGDEKDKVLNNINFQINKGEILALVGPSGAGKSTLVDLIPRFYDTLDGSIKIDGKDIKELKINSLRSLMGIVTQETFLFDDSVRANIAYGLENISDDKIKDAAIAANAHEFIKELPDGYNTIIGCLLYTSDAADE